LYTLKKERAASAGSIWKGLMLGQAVRVPRHIELSEPGMEADQAASHVEFFAKACGASFGSWKTGGTGLIEPEMLYNHIPCLHITLGI
jgi:hypothetical protein